MGLKISQLPDMAADTTLKLPASDGQTTYKLPVGLPGGIPYLDPNGHFIPANGAGVFAPAGFGLGENPVYVADANNAIQNGWYAINDSTLNLPDPTSIWNYCLLRVDVGGRPEVFMLQTVCTPFQVWRGCKVQRVYVGGVWQPWEWVNPPMLTGVEYRTTERYMGKPVYVKVVDCGLIADNKAVAHGISNMGECMSFKGARTELPMPQIFNHSLNDPWTCYVMNVDRTNITLACGSSSAGANCQVALKYTKTTD